MGRDAVAAFARWMRVSEADIAGQMGLEPPLTPALVGAAVVRILTDAACAGEVGFVAAAPPAPVVIGALGCATARR